MVGTVPTYPPHPIVFIHLLTRLLTYLLIFKYSSIEREIYTAAVYGGWPYITQAVHATYLPPILYALSLAWCQSVYISGKRQPANVGTSAGLGGWYVE